MNRLAPSNVSAPAERAGRLKFAFGRRFFLLLFIGLVWIAPAWREPRFLYALVLWDAVVLLLWALDLNRLARPEQIELRRIWSQPLGLAKRMSVTLELRNTSNGAVSTKVSD